MRKINRTRNVLVFGCTHEPFCKKGFLEFLLDTKRKFKCNIVVHTGDLTDNNAISYHEHDPDGMSPGDEYKITKRKLKSTWYKAFKKLVLCRGNHDRLVDRKRKTIGLPKDVFKPYRDIWDLPDDWRDVWNIEIDGVQYEHGTGFSGKFPHMTAAGVNRRSTVISHCHSVAGVGWSANEKDCIFGMAIGCGIDRKTYAFSYGKEHRRKPIVGCGVVTDNGKYAQFIPMDLGRK